MSISVVSDRGKLRLFWDCLCGYVQCNPKRWVGEGGNSFTDIVGFHSEFI